MPGTVPDRAPLGASTTNRKWYLDVRELSSSTYVGVFGLTEGKPRPSEATTQDDSDFDGNGFKSETATALSWGFDGKVNRKTRQTDSLAYDPGQEIIRKAARRIGAVLGCRYYEMEPNGPRVEAYEGLVSPRWTPDGGGMDALDAASFSLMGRGAPLEIAHPEGVTAAPSIANVTPQGAATGAQVVIQGARFDTTTSAAGYVKVGGTNATYKVYTADTIVATLPSGAAGPVVVNVGTAAISYVRGA